MITGLVNLAGTDLDDNLQLTGDKNNPDIAFSVRDLLGGNQVIQISPRSGGAAMALTAIYEGTKQQGQFCSYQIDELKAVCATGQLQTLDYHGNIHELYILSFDVAETDERELPHPNKKFYGTIYLQKP